MTLNEHWMNLRIAEYRKELKIKTISRSITIFRENVVREWTTRRDGMSGGLIRNLQEKKYPVENVYVHELFRANE